MPHQEMDHQITPPQAVCAEGTPAVILENSSEQLLGMAGLTAEEQKAISSGKKTDIILSV